MELFEIHITGSPNIIDAAEKMNIKTIVVDLLDPNHKKMRTEYMTSFIEKKESYEECKKFVDELVLSLQKDVEISRIKIESPYYPHYKNQSLYMESHFENENDKFPISRNARKTLILATDREYDKEQYDTFIEKYNGKDVELCLSDSFIDEDKDWFDAFKEREDCI